MSKFLASALLVILIFAAGSPADAAFGLHQPTTYYISPDGADSNIGAAASPWHTLQHAAREALPGDTIIVRKGDYAGFVLGWDGPQGGREDLPITYQGEPGANIVSRNGKTKDGIDLEGNCGHTIIRGFHVNNASGSITRAGIRVDESNHVVISDNVCDGNGVWAIFTSHSSDLLIENNITSHSGKQHGVYVSNSADHVVIRGNRIFGNANCGIHMNGDASQGGTGLITHALVENNIIYDNGRSGGSAINCDGVQHSIIRCNVIYNNRASGISLFRDDGSDGSKDNLVVNNTIVMGPESRWALNIKNGSTGNTVFNNILLNANDNRGSISVAGDSMAGFSSDHNILEDRFSADDKPVSLSDWQQATGQDQHSQVSTSDELFVGADAGDFHLAPKSPAIHAGVPEVTSHKASPADLEKHAWDGAPDIGAYHFHE